MKSALLPGLPHAMARLPLSIRSKLSAVLLTLVGLLITIGGIGLHELGQVHQRTEDLVRLQRKVAAFRQLQQDTMAQLHNVANVMLAPDERLLDTTLRQLNQFGYDLDRLQFVSADDAELYARVRSDYDAFIGEVGGVIAMVRAGRVAEAREAQVRRVVPLAERLERMTNELVNRAEAAMLTQVDAGAAAHARSRMLMLAIAGGSVTLALLLGYALSWSLVEPVREMDARLAEIAAGQFERRIDIPNRDELGALAADLNRMSAELGRLVREVEAANRNKSAFLANMSHELRTPLNTIIGFSEVLVEQMFGEVNTKQMEYLKDIHGSGQHLLTLINDVLDLSKIEAGRMELELSEVDVGDLLEHTLALVRERAARNGLTLALDVPADLPLWVADARKVKQVLLNLLSNAVKFTPAGGSVTLSARCVGEGNHLGEGDLGADHGHRLGHGSGDRHDHDNVDRSAVAIEISVIDTGVGIAEQDQAAVFEAFRQASGSYLRKSEGTGLGLALAQRFVELHGGRLDLRSAPGQGSTFTFTLPARTLEAA